MLIVDYTIASMGPSINHACIRQGETSQDPPLT